MCVRARACFLVCVNNRQSTFATAWVCVFIRVLLIHLKLILSLLK